MDKNYPKSIASKQYVTVSICLGPHVTVNGIMTYTIDITVTVTITVSTCLGPHVTVNGIVTYTIDSPSNILEQFPPTLIVLAKNDILLDEGLAFESLLQNAKVSVKKIIYDDVFHGFFAKPILTNDKQTKEICESLLTLNKD